jgi:hypothetical protein
MSVEVAELREVGCADALGLTQTSAFPAVVDGRHRDLVQSHVYLASPSRGSGEACTANPTTHRLISWESSTS